MSSQDANAIPNHPPESGSGGDGLSTRLAGVETRLAHVEAKMEFVATREDIANLGRELAALIVNKEASMQRWLLGITCAALASVVIALLRTFA